MTELFTKVPHWLIRESDLLDGNELLLYLAMLSRADKKGICYPSVSLLAREARMSESTVRRTRKRLVAKGLVTVTRRRIGDSRNDSNLYQVALPKRPAVKFTQTDPVDNALPEVQDDVLNGSHGDWGGVTVTPPPSHGDWGDGSTVTGEEEPVKEDPLKKTLRLTQERNQDELFAFEEKPKATAKQLDYLNDLHIFLTEHIPDTRSKTKWADLSTAEATGLIDTYWSQIDRGRGGMWESAVDEYHSAFKGLSPMGRRWIANGCMPERLDAA